MVAAVASWSKIKGNALAQTHLSNLSLKRSNQAKTPFIKSNFHSFENLASQVKKLERANNFRRSRQRSSPGPSRRCQHAGGSVTDAELLESPDAPLNDLIEAIRNGAIEWKYFNIAIHGITRKKNEHFIRTTRNPDTAVITGIAFQCVARNF